MKNPEKISKIEQRQAVEGKRESEYEERLRFYLSDDPKRWESFYLSEDACINKVILDSSVEQGILTVEQISALFQKEIEKYVFNEEVLTKSEVIKIQNIILLALRHGLEIPDSLLTKIEEKEEEQRENPVKIKGFDKINLRELGFANVEGIDAEDVLRKAMEILPDDAWANVEKIEYADEIKSVPDKYGIKRGEDGKESESGATFYSRDKYIIFHKVSLENKTDGEKRGFIASFADKLLHEFGHSIDPRFCDQLDLSSDDEKETLKQWEEVREEESPFSSYVIKIENENKSKEDFLKDVEDYAESVSAALRNPIYLQYKAPKRQKFCQYWLKKRFPKYDPEKTAQKMEKYHALLANLE